MLIAAAPGSATATGSFPTGGQPQCGFVGSRGGGRGGRSYPVPRQQFHGRQYQFAATSTGTAASTPATPATSRGENRLNVKGRCSQSAFI